MMQTNPTGRPAQMMGFGDAVKTSFQKSFTLQGRASRSEYWWFYSFLILAQIVFIAVDISLGTPLSILLLGALPAGFCVLVRRFHDLGKSGWWYLIIIIPLIGALIVLFWLVSEGEDSTNNYGAVPTNTIDNNY